MGFSHYFTLNATIKTKQWKALTTDVATILNNLPDGVVVGNGHGKLGSSYIINADEIAFNGIEEDGHETFYIEKNGRGFNFCKTAQKPYDVAVVACLVAMKRILGDGVEVSSDGNRGDLQEGIDLANGLLGMTFEKLLDVK